MADTRGVFGQISNVLLMATVSPTMTAGVEDLKVSLSPSKMSAGATNQRCQRQILATCTKSQAARDLQ